MKLILHFLKYIITGIVVISFGFSSLEIVLTVLLVSFADLSSYFESNFDYFFGNR